MENFLPTIEEMWQTEVSGRLCMQWFAKEWRARQALALPPQDDFPWNHEQ